MKVGEIWQLKSDLDMTGPRLYLRRIIIVGIRYQEFIEMLGRRYKHNDYTVAYCSASKMYSHVQEAMKNPWDKSKVGCMGRRLLVGKYYRVNRENR